MPFNKDINGYDNEYEFVEYLNGKTVKSLNPLFRELIDELFSTPDEKTTIFTRIDKDRKKFDIVIKINNTVKRISIKKGVKNSVHIEGISTFIHFLIQNHVPKEVIIDYLKYHYADGTTNGTGKIRLSAEEYKQTHQEDIDLINQAINKPILLSKAIDRFVIKGRNSIDKIDALIYGVVEDFIWIKSSDIKKIIMSKINDYSTAVHFSVLTCQPLDRCLNYNQKLDDKRFCVQIKWYNIADDIIENMNNNI